MEGLARACFSGGLSEKFTWSELPEQPTLPLFKEKAMTASSTWTGFRLSLGRPRFALFRIAILMAIVVAGVKASPCQINACKYLYVSDFTSDPYGIAQELRNQGRKGGFIVVTSRAEVPAGDMFKTCLMTGSWSAQGFGGNVNIRVMDPMTQEVIGEATVNGTNWWNVSRTVRNAVAKVYKRLGYTGFSEEAYRLKMQREYPARPKLVITEDEVRKSAPTGQIEGIWADPKDEYRLAIVPAPKGSGSDYYAVVLRSTSPIWTTGEIKAELRSTASTEVFTSTYFMGNKKPVGTTFTIDHDAVLRSSVITPNGPADVIFLRVWPTVETKDAGNPSKGGASGTGFLINNQGLIATNWHVVSNASHITIAFPGWHDPVPVDLVIRDTTNDLAILRLADTSKLARTCTDFPYQLSSANSVSLGEHVSTIGYPLRSLLGTNPKFTEGVISSKTGIQDDPRTLQISAQVQPGSSGSPLFDEKGQIVGIVVATLDAGVLYQAANALPQNVNFAIRSDYLLNLLAMLPQQSPTSRAAAFTPEKASHCIGTISAW